MLSSAYDLRLVALRLRAQEAARLHDLFRAARETVATLTEISRFEEAFEGITVPTVSSVPAYQRVDLTFAAVITLPWKNVLVDLQTLSELGQRITTLNEVVRQNALTADDAPQAGWGTSLELGSA